MLRCVSVMLMSNGVGEEGRAWPFDSSIFGKLAGFTGEREQLRTSPWRAGQGRGAALPRHLPQGARPRAALTPELPHLFPVHLDRRGSLGLVAGDQPLVQALGMDEHIGDYRPYVARERFQMVGERKTDGLARLGHDVRRVSDRPGEARERLLHPGAEQSGDGAGEEAARAQDDHIRLPYGGNHAGRSCRARWFYLDPRDACDLARRTAAGDVPSAYVTMGSGY